MRSLPAFSRRLAILAWMTGPLLVGAALRLWNLSRQALLDDELHGLRRALREPIPAILSAFRIPDTSLPLTALTRFAFDHGVLVDETSLRLPSLLAGWLLAAVGGLLLARRESPLAGAVFAGLAASSPLLVIYSRNARPYAVATTLAFLALALFVAGWERRSLARFSAAALIGALAVWALPLALAVVGAPWTIGLVAAVRERRAGGGKIRRDFLLGLLLLLLALAAVLVPPWQSLRGAASRRLGMVSVERPPAIVDGARLVAGARSPAIASVVLLAGAAGLALASRGGAIWGWTLSGTVGAHLLGVAVARDFSMRYSLGAGRTLLLALPPLLAGVACLASRLLPALRERTGAATAAGLVAALVPLAAGPLPERLTVVPELLSSADRMEFTLPAALLSWPLPEIYRREPLLSARSVVDATHVPEFRFLRPLTAEALAYRRRLLLGMPSQEFPTDRVRFAASASLGARALLGSGADALILRLRPGSQVVEFDRRGGLELSRKNASRVPRLDAVAERARLRLLASFGPPDASDGERWVWDLRRLRRRLGA